MTTPEDKARQIVEEFELHLMISGHLPNGYHRDRVTNAIARELRDRDTAIARQSIVIDKQSEKIEELKATITALSQALKDDELSK